MAITPTALPTVSANQPGAIANFNTAWNAIDDLTAIFNGWQSTDDAVKAVVINATGDGVADDTAALAAAVALLPAVGGTIIFPVPTAYYKVNAGTTLTSKTRIALVGAAPDVEIRFAAGTTDTQYSSWPDYGKDSIFRLIDCTDVLVKNLKLNGNLSNRTGNATTESFNSCITAVGCTRLTVEDCHIVEGMTDGVFVGRNSGGTVSTKVRISRCEIDACRRNNVSVIGVDNCVVEDSVIINAGTVQGVAPMAGIDVEPEAIGTSAKVKIRRNTVTGSAGTYAVTCGGTGTVVLRVEDNDISGNTTTGLNLSAVSNPNSRTLIKGNIISGHTAGSGLRFTTTNADLVTKNVFDGNKWGVVGATGADKVRIHANRFVNNTYYGAYFTSFVNVQLTDNDFIDNASVQGLIDVAGFAAYGTRTDVNSIWRFDNNLLMNSVGATSLMKGAEVDATCNARGTGNLGKNLSVNTQMLRRIAGHGNWSIDAGARVQGATGEANFNDQLNGAGRLLIGSKYHYFGTAAPTSATWERGDWVYNTSPQIGAPVGWVCVSNGTPGSWVGMGPLPNMGTNGADADSTLTVGTSSLVKPYTSTLTADRTVTLSTTGALDGASFRIYRTGAGAFNLSIGGLKNLTQNQWADVMYNGASWVLTGFGSL